MSNCTKINAEKGEFIDKYFSFVIMCHMKKLPVKKQTISSVKNDMNDTALTVGQQLQQMQSMMQKMFMIIIVLVVAVGGILIKDFVIKPPENTTGTTAAANAGQQPAQVTVTKDQIKNLFTKAVVKFGDVNSKLVFVEITDPSCPYCHVAAGINTDLMNQMGANFKTVAEGGTYLPPVPEIKKLVDSGKAAFAILYTPGHGNGQMGMKALFCANEEGKYWEAHDLIYSAAGYELQNTTVKNDKEQSQTVADFLSAAVDPTTMKTCLDSGKYESKLGDEQQLAASVGVSGTPGFFVNTTAFAGAYSFSDMESAVKAAL